jgi:hypothetical protein
METKAKSPNPADVKKQLEAIAGHEIDLGPEQLINLWYPAGAYDYTNGSSVLKSFLLPGKQCNSATLLDVSGFSSTTAAGNRVFLLSDFVCLPPVRSFAEQINVIATASSATPIFVTTTHALINNATDVQITIFAWDANGVAAPNVGFNWRCRLVSNQIIV